MPSRILANHICTCVQSLRSGDGGACVVEHLELEQRSRPEKAGEDSDPNVVRHWMGFLGQRLPFQASCMAPQAFHVDGQRIAAASVGGNQAVGDLGNDSCRGARKASTVGR